MSDAKRLTADDLDARIAALPPGLKEREALERITQDAKGAVIDRVEFRAAWHRSLGVTCRPKPADATPDPEPDAGDSSSS